jgi:tetratricopeptide (TPR) repeat protein
MLIRSAEQSYEKGLEALEDARMKEALAYFEAAVAIERKQQVASPQARYLSYYGLCLGVAGRQFHAGARLCREAVAMERYNPDMEWNLGRLMLATGRRKEAYEAFVRGLRQQPDHVGIRRELYRMGRRRRPVLRFLSRRNPLNVFLGRRRMNQHSAA